MIGDVVRAAFKVADEVVVMDSGSTDQTRTIAEKEGARVVFQEWLGNGGQKRAAEELCSHSWLLDLDADEIVSDALADEIRALFAGGEPWHRVYRLPLVLVSPLGGVWRRAYVRSRAKLYDVRALRMPDHKAWDQLSIPPDMATGHLTAPLLHHNFSDIAHMVGKLNSWSSLGAREGRLKPLHVLIPRLLFAFPFYFLQHYAVRGLWRAGLYGFTIAMTGAFGRWLRDAKMLEIHLGKRKKDI
jgi:glycosyltransferase involved in cell wall biosynthesis